MSDWLIHHELEKQARWRPTQVALVHDDREYTYERLARRMDQLARFIQESGVEPGEYVLAHASNHADLYSLFFACSKAGVVFSPVSRYLSTDDIRFVCETLEPALLFHTDAGLVEETLESVRQNLQTVPAVSLDAYAAESRTSALDDVSDDPVETDESVTTETIHNLFWTSGTTGRPKGVLRDHNATLHFADPLLSQFPFAEANRRLTTNDMMFAAPYLQYGLPTVTTGGTNVILRKYDPETVCRTIESYDINTTLLVFSQASLLLEYLETHDSDLEIEFVHAVLPTDTIARELAEISGTLYHIYATTEAGLPLVKHLQAPFAETPALGRPGVGADIVLVETGETVGEALDRGDFSTGDEGELYCRGNVTMTRFLDTGAFSGELRPEWVPTGDVVRITDDSEVVFVGRADNRIRSGGVNIYPENVETVLVRHPDIEEAVVVGVDDEKWNHRVCAVIVPSPAADVDDEFIDDVDAFCKSHESLARSKRPRDYAIETAIEALPTSAVGKLDRAAIAKRYFE